MAQSIADIIGKMKTSIHGRRLGLDQTGRLTGALGTRKVVTEATSDTTGTALPNHGICNVVTTTNDTWTLTDPEVGCEVAILTGSTSTGVHTVTCAAATILSSVSSTGPGVTLTGSGAGFHLIGLSTALWGVTARIGTTATSYVSSA